MPNLRFPFLLHLCLLVGAGQAVAATLTGRVTDPDNRPVPSARVVLSSPLGTVADVTSGHDGAYVVRDLPAGTYDLRVIATGFQADPIAVTVGAEDARDVAISLHVAAVSESVVVSASPVDVPLSRAPEAVTVITAADLAARQIETVSDALRLVPGLNVIRSGDRGGITSVFPRGGNSNYTLVLIDGIRANNFGGGYDFAHLPVADIDRIEVVRGPQSAVFGSDAIGSVVQIVTRRGGQPRVGGFVEGGSQSTAHAGVDASGSSGAWIWGFGAEHTKSDGFTGLSSSGARVSNDDYHLSEASGSIGRRADNGADMLVTASVNRNERGFPGPFGSDPAHHYGGIDTVARGINKTVQLGGRFSMPSGTRLRHRVEASYTNVDSDFTSSFGPSTSGTRRFDARAQEDLALTGSISASGGIEFLHERGTSTFITGATSNQIPVQRGVAAVYGELRYSASERLLASAGVRLEHLTRDALEANPNGFPPRPAFADQTINSLNPKVAVSYLLTSPAQKSGMSTRVHASAGTGIRPPEAFEIAFTNNPDLQPERSRSFDAGIEQRVAGGAFVAGATAFFNRYDDLIVTVGKSLRDASQYQTDNISNARARGVELTGDARIWRAIAVHANYTFLSTEILSSDRLAGIAPSPFTVGDPLTRRPRHQGAVDITYSEGRVNAFVDLVSRARVLDVEPNFGASGGLFKSPGYTVVNVGAGFRAAPHVELFARILNVADRQYEETLGYPALRRQGMVGVRIAASR